jgi:transcriptional regulator GlxA family with amidase domain
MGIEQENRDHRVAVLLLEGAKALDVGIASHVFGKRPSMPYETRVCGESAGVIEGPNGLDYAVSHGLESGARIAAISTGAFTLAAAGLLDGGRATTHWHYTHVLQERYPGIDVDEDVLFVDSGQVLTSAGAASGIDLCLHIIRRDHGVGLANHVARRLVSAPYRSGGQAQYVPHSIPEPLGDAFAATRTWALEHLDEDLTLARLAEQANVSPRTFSRRFTADTSRTPMQWVMRARIDRARELLERTDLTVTQIANRTGLHSDANLRRHFHAVLGTSPTAYRAAFRADATGATTPST